MRNLYFVTIILTVVFISPARAQDSLNVHQLSLLDDYWTSPSFITVDDTIAYLLTGASGMRLVSVSDPTNPVEIGYFDPSVSMVHFAIHDSYAYIAVADSGIIIADIEIPQHPTIVASIPTIGSVREIVVSENYLYSAVTGDDVGVKIFDVSTPSQPIEASFLFTGGNSIDAIEVNSSLLFVLTSTILQVYDVSTPESPEHLDSRNWFRDLDDIEVTSDYAYVASDDSLVVFDITVPASPEEIVAVALTGYARHLEISDSLVYIACGSQGLVIVDISLPEQPEQVAHLDSLGNTLSVHVVGTYSYVASSDKGLRVVSSANLPELIEIGLLDKTGTALDIASYGTYAYVMEGRRGLRVIDVSSENSPIEINRVAPRLSVSSIDIQDNYAYVTEGDSGITIFDLTNPVEPSMIGSYDFSSEHHSARHVAVSGDNAYVATEWDIYVISVLNPFSPQEIAVIEEPGLPDDISVSGDYLFIADHVSGIWIYDISIPESPFEVGQYHFGYPSSTNDVVRAGDYIYVAANDLFIADISNPANPVEVGFLDLPASGSSISILGDHVVLACRSRGVRVIDVLDPSRPFVTGYYDTQGDSRSFWFEDNIVYLADYSYVGIYDCSLATADLPRISTTPSSLQFGMVPIGEPSTTSLLLSNYGHVPLTLEELSLPTGYVSDFDPPIVVDSSDIHSINVTFTPESQQLYLGDLEIHSNDPHSPTTVSVSGQGVSLEPNISVTPTSLDFGNVSVEDSLSLSISITSIGASDVTIDTVITPGDFHTDFSGSLVLGMGEQVEVHVSFLPSTIGQYSGVLVVLSDAISNPDIVTLLGNGIASYADDESIGIPVEFYLDSNFPNPFNPSTTITFGLPKSEHTTLRVFDIQGRQIETLVSAVYPVGHHSIAFDGSDLPSGIYFYQLQAGSFVETKKMVLLK